MDSERTERRCRVCGHELAPGMKICDRCGSVQRGAKARGEDGEPGVRVVPCKYCGKSTTEEEKVCNACQDLEERVASGYYGPKLPEPPARRAGLLETLRAIWAAVKRFFRRLFHVKG